MKKRVLSLSLALAMAASLTACGSSSSTTETTAAAAADATTAAAGASSEASSDKVFKIGGIGPVTGAAAVYGLAVKNGAQIAVDEINADGGINGYQIEFNFQDDEHDAEKSVNAYNTLKDWGMQALVGTTTSAPCIAVADKTAADNMFQITPSGSAVECVAEPNAFRVCFSDPDQGSASAEYIASHNLAKKVAVIYDSSDVYSSGIYAKFKATAAEKGLEIVSEQAFTSSNNQDFSVAISAIKASGAELVFLPIYYQQAALILTQAEQAALDVRYFGCDGLDSIIKQLGDDANLAEGVMLLTPYAPDSTEPKSKAFTDAYVAKFSITPNQFAADAYDAIYAIKAALEKADVKDADISVSDLCDKLVAAMTQIEVDGVTGKMTWNAEGEPTKPAKAMVIKNGEYASLD